MGKFEDDRPHRSDHYQYKIREVGFTQAHLESFTNQDSIEYHLNPFTYDERVLELYDQLRDEFYKIINSQLTQRQREVYLMYVDGYTQTEISKKLNVNQSSIAKCLNGNIDYRDAKKVHGGLIKKLKKAVERSAPIQNILRQINEIQQEKL